MRSSIQQKLLLVLIGVMATSVVILWLNSGESTKMSERIPGTDRTAPQNEEAQAVPFTSDFQRGSGQASDWPGEWPCFRGTQRDGLSRESIKLARDWGSDGPAVDWEATLGEGHAGPVVYGGCVYLLDYDRNNQRDAIRCLSFATGQEIWRFSYPVKIKRNHGMSRTTPAVTEKYIVTLGPKGHVVCLDRTTGQMLWMIDLVKDYGTVIPPWYAGQCPLIENDLAILAPSGPTAMMIAVDCATGEVIWQAGNPRGWKMTHTSITPMVVDGVRMYVYSASGGVAAINAGDGEIMWDTPGWQINIAAIASPVDIGDGRVLFTGGYNAGAMMGIVERSGNDFTFRELWRLGAKQFGATQQTPVFYENHIYGIRPDGQLVCLTLDGETLWQSGANTKFALGPLVIGDGLIYALNDTGILRLTVAHPSTYQPLAEAEVLQGHDAWGPLALTGGKLLARDLTRMVCLDVSE